MKQFRTSFVGGYQKEDVDGYLEALMQEMENLKEETDRKLQEERGAADELKRQLEQERARNEKLEREQGSVDEFKQQIQQEQDTENALRQQLEEEKAQNAKLREQIADYERRITELREQPYSDGASAERIKVLQERVERYEQIMPQLADLMSDAKVKADMIVEKSEADAKNIRTKAEEDAFRLRIRMETELKEKKRKQEEKFLFAKYKILDYLNAVSESQKKLISTYNELGFLVKELPLRMDNTFPDEEMVVVAEGGREVFEKEHPEDVLK